MESKRDSQVEIISANDNQQSEQAEKRSFVDTTVDVIRGLAILLMFSVSYAPHSLMKRLTWLDRSSQEFQK